MIVMKFGGTSVGNAANIRRVCELTRARRSRQPVLVVSAHAGVTDLLVERGRAALKDDTKLDSLLKIHYDIIDELGLDRRALDAQVHELKELLEHISLTKDLSRKALDYLMSFGERMSSLTIAGALNRAGLPAKAVFAYDLGLVTDNHFGQTQPLPEAEDNIAMRFRYGDAIPVVTGFIGKNLDGDITTLGRNGSDYTAAILAAALHVDEIQFFKDVDGILSADPSLVPSAQPIGELSFEEVSELTYYGGQFLHPHTLAPAMRHDIPVRMLNTLRPESPGTLVRNATAPSTRPVKSIVYKEDLLLVNVSAPQKNLTPEFLSRVFQTLEKSAVPVNMLSTSKVTASFITDRSGEEMEETIKSLREFSEVEVESDKTIVCIVGQGLKNNPELLGQVFQTLAQQNIPVRMLSQGASKINLAFAVDSVFLRPAVIALHHLLFE